MRKTNFCLIVMFTIIANCCAQKKNILSGANGDTAYIAYTINKKEIKFYFNDIWGIPSVKADINKNGKIDGYIDRSYGIADGPVDNVICTQYLISENSSTHCGAAKSGARLLRKNFDIIFTIPLKELVISSGQKDIHVAIRFANVENGKWSFQKYPDSYDTFGKVYEIKLK